MKSLIGVQKDIPPGTAKLGLSDYNFFAEIIDNA